MRIINTSKSNPNNRVEVNESNASSLLVNNTIVAVFEILGEIEAITLQTDYYGDFVKKEIEAKKSFVGSRYISRLRFKKPSLETTKISNIIDSKLRDAELSDEQASEIMEKVSKKVLEFLQSNEIDGL